jgi:hypothetical protein
MNITVTDGLFCHLGTSMEFFNLLQCGHLHTRQFRKPTTAAESMYAEGGLILADAGSEELVTMYCSATDCKLRAFASKYDLHILCNSIQESMGSGSTVDNIAMNSLLFNYGDHGPLYCSRNSVVENCCLSGRGVRLGHTSIVSNIPCGYGNNFHCKAKTIIQCIPIQSSGRLVFVTLGIDDDVKAPFDDPKATICGVYWSKFFEVIHSL